jgi:hypothetical protein
MCQSHVSFRRQRLHRSHLSPGLLLDLTNRNRIREAPEHFPSNLPPTRRFLSVPGLALESRRRPRLGYLKPHFAHMRKLPAAPAKDI